ncbi:peptidoglycan binding domain-containing [Fusarium sporotrichioides]|uniref:Peptidoglycan binding domain-containing n=1 Tax=Fusarium sporotrichioides TaxID=5514 RepID=A0A395SI34_FUSSP|nr:peptidoglycan binding domain-containing [Fusarium sporotrichioides]
MSTPTATKWIICLDGTSNSESQIDKSRTNVSRIRECISREDNNQVRQFSRYWGGIGTGFRNPLNALQQVVGDGIDMIIIEAYKHLCENYQENRGDSIFLIGFSRGAYAARCIADLIDQEGLPLNGGMEKVHAIYKNWSQNSSKKRSRQPRMSERHYPDITACALWDTVSSIGMPIPKGMLRRKFASVDSELPGNVQHVFQALSLHEYRYHFFPIVLLPSTASHQPTIEQCWFAGYHADVGGGCEKDALAHFALVWMISKLETWLKFDIQNLFSDGSFPTDTTWKVGDPCGVRHRRGTHRLPITDSMSFGFMIGGSKYRIPQMEFWNQDGPYTVTDHQESTERMHATARFLSQRNLEWVRKDIARFDNLKHGAGDPEPNTVLVWVRDWLENHRRTAVPH